MQYKNTNSGRRNLLNDKSQLVIPIPILFLKSIANTKTNTVVTILFTVFTLSNVHFFLRSSINKVDRMILVKKWQNHYSLQWHDAIAISVISGLAVTLIPDLWPFHFKTESVHLCSQLHQSCKFDEIRMSDLQDIMVMVVVNVTLCSAIVTKSLMRCLS